MITRDDIVWAYKLFLDREPENEYVIQEHMKVKDLKILRTNFITHPEFLRKNPSIVKKKYFCCETKKLLTKKYGKNIELLLRLIDSEYRNSYEFVANIISKIIYDGSNCIEFNTYSDKILNVFRKKNPTGRNISVSVLYDMFCVNKYNDIEIFSSIFSASKNNFKLKDEKKCLDFHAYPFLEYSNDVCHFNIEDNINNFIKIPSVTGKYFDFVSINSQHPSDILFKNKYEFCNAFTNAIIYINNTCKHISIDELLDISKRLSGAMLYSAEFFLKNVKFPIQTNNNHFFIFNDNVDVLKVRHKIQSDILSIFGLLDRYDNKILFSMF